MPKKVKSHDDAVRLSRYRDEFEHPSVFGKWRETYGLELINNELTWLPNGRVYVIYSYGLHFPIYVYDELSQHWLGNQDKYSRTTSTHQSKYRPSEVAKWFDTTTLQQIVKQGYAGFIANRMENGLPT